MAEGGRMLCSQMVFLPGEKVGFKGWVPAILKMKRLDRKTCASSKFDLDVF